MTSSVRVSALRFRLAAVRVAMFPPAGRHKAVAR